MALTPRQVFRYYEVDGVPSSGNRKPKKSEIIQLLDQLFGVSRGGWVVARTQDELNGITPENETDGGVVLAGVGAGYYDRDGGAWVFGRGFPDTFARVALSGSGTDQTGVVQAGVNPASIEVFFAKVATANTGAMTLSISGEAARPVVNLAGNPLSAGEWTGMVMFYLNDEGDYQLLIDAGAAASAAASASRAEDEADRAQEIADGIAPGTVPDGAVTDAKVSLASKLYNRINDMASVRDFGAVGDGTTDDTDAITDALAATTGQVYFPPGVYVADASLLGNHLRYTGDGELKIGSDLLPVGPIKDTRLLNVPATFSTVKGAWDYAQAKEISNTGLAVVKLDDGTYDNVPVLEVSSAYGDRVHVIGNVASPSSVVIKPINAGQFAQFLATRNGQIGFINGLTLESKQWVSHGVWSGYGYGIFATQSGSISVGAAVRVNKWYWGIAATIAGSVSCVAGVIVDEAGDGGFFAREGGSMVCAGCIATNCADTAQSLGYGFISELGASMFANDSEAHDCLKSGFFANQGKMWAQGAKAHHNGQHGFSANRTGYIEGIGSDAYDNAGAGYRAENCSVIEAFDAQADRNVNGFFADFNSSIIAQNSLANTNSTNGYRVTYNGTIQRQGAGGTGNGAFDSQTINAAGPTGGWILG